MTKQLNVLLDYFFIFNLLLLFELPLSQMFSPEIP